MESLDLLLHLVDIGITLYTIITINLYAFKLPTTVSVEGILEFLTESLDLELLLDEVVLHVVYFVLEVGYLASLWIFVLI